MDAGTMAGWLAYVKQLNVFVCRLSWYISMPTPLDMVSFCKPELHNFENN